MGDFAWIVNSCVKLSSSVRLIQLLYCKFFGFISVITLLLTILIIAVFCDFLWSTWQHWLQYGNGWVVNVLLIAIAPQTSSDYNTHTHTQCVQQIVFLMNKLGHQIVCATDLCLKTLISG